MKIHKTIFGTCVYRVVLRIEKRGTGVWRYILLDAANVDSPLPRRVQRRRRSDIVVPARRRFSHGNKDDRRRVRGRFQLAALSDSDDDFRRDVDYSRRLKDHVAVRRLLLVSRCPLRSPRERDSRLLSGRDTRRFWNRAESWTSGNEWIRHRPDSMNTLNIRIKKEQKIPPGFARLKFVGKYQAV